MTTLLRVFQEHGTAAAQTGAEAVQQGVEQAVQEAGQFRFLHDVPCKNTVVDIDRKGVFPGRSHQAFQPPVGRMQAVGVVGSGQLHPEIFE